MLGISEYALFTLFMDYENALKGFLDNDKKLKQLPSKAAKKLLALRYVSEQFTHDREYSEKEINEIIKNAISFGDHSLIRRELVDAKILSRSNDGRIYKKIFADSGSEQ